MQEIQKIKRENRNVLFKQGNCSTVSEETNVRTIQKGCMKMKQKIVTLLQHITTHLGLKYCV